VASRRALSPRRVHRNEHEPHGRARRCILQQTRRTLATPEPIKDWSLTSLKEKLIKIGAKVVSQGRYVAFQMAEVAIPRQMFQEILRLIAELRPQPPPAPT
jgi:Transposase DDE domain group 1